MITRFIGALFIVGFLFQPINLLGESKPHARGNLLKIYEKKQGDKDLRLYYMVKSKLKTRNDKIYFLNLSLKDKRVYAKYLLNGSDVSFEKLSRNLLFF